MKRHTHASTHIAAQLSGVYEASLSQRANVGHYYEYQYLVDACSYDVKETPYKKIHQDIRRKHTAMHTYACKLSCDGRIQLTHMITEMHVSTAAATSQQHEQERQRNSFLATQQFLPSRSNPHMNNL